MAAKKRKRKKPTPKKRKKVIARPKPKKRPKPKPRKRTPIKKAKKRSKKTGFAKYKGWKAAQPKSLTKEDGTLARHPSRLRELPKKERRLVRQVIEEREGEEDFDVLMYDIADTYDIDIAEVYTFWMSE